MCYLGGDELQAAALTVLLLLQQGPHLGVILGQSVLTCPRTFFIHSTSGGVGLLPTHAEDDCGPLAQRLLTQELTEGGGLLNERDKSTTDDLELMLDVTGIWLCFFKYH